MSDQLDLFDHSTIGDLRNMARQGHAPSAMVRELRRRLGNEAHIVTLLNYFRQAFCLTLADAKPIAALSRNETRNVQDESLLDEMLLPAIQNHRSDWECLKQ